jgi:hypothetical protein
MHRPEAMSERYLAGLGDFRCDMTMKSAQPTPWPARAASPSGPRAPEVTLV